MGGIGKDKNGKEMLGRCGGRQVVIGKERRAENEKKRWRRKGRGKGQ